MSPSDEPASAAGHSSAADTAHLPPPPPLPPPLTDAAAAHLAPRTPAPPLPAPLRAVAGALGGAWTQFKDLGEPAPAAAEAPADDHLYAEGAVFAKPKATAYHDTVWQSNPPRMLRYKANVLHGYGWVPGLIPRNFKGTVLCDPHLQGQVLVLWLWMLFIRSTGLYAAPRDQKVFVLFFGTPYMTAILNLCMVITFCLGLFVTLVVNRWWDIRVNYGVARSLSIELAYIVSTNMRATKGPAGATPEAAQLAGEQNAFARSECMRYLNFAHLLMLCDAQRSEKGDFSDSPDKRLGRFLREHLASVPVLRQLLKVEAGAMSGVSGLGDVMGNPRTLLRSMKQVSVGLVSAVGGAVADVGSAFRAVTTGKLELEGLGLEEAAALRRKAAAARSAAAEVDFQQFYVMGLVTPEEWALIRQGERDGIPSWRTVYNWVAALMADATASGRLDERVATSGGMQAMCMEIRNAGGRVFTMMNTQLPFTYVHLVSFICHTYLFILATYFGFILAIGIPGVNWVISVDEAERTAIWSGPVPRAPRVVATGNVYTHCTEDPRVALTNATASPKLLPLFKCDHPSGRDGDGPLMVSLIFLVIAFAVTIIQGMLSMHSLLENPFGTHPCKFPLRFYNIDHIRQTRAMLREPTEREPSTIRSIFASKLTKSAAEPAQHSHDPQHPHAAELPPGMTAEGAALLGAAMRKGIYFVHNNSSQMHTDVAASTSHASI